ncbi:hypothetical protein JCM11641_001974 [Rhodosporidiobolus odoratus]
MHAGQQQHGTSTFCPPSLPFPPAPAPPPSPSFAVNANPAATSSVPPTPRKAPRNLQLLSLKSSSTTSLAAPIAKSARVEYSPPILHSTLDILLEPLPAPPYNPTPPLVYCASICSLHLKPTPAPPVPTAHWMFQSQPTRRPKTAESHATTGTSTSKSSLGRAFARAFGKSTSSFSTDSRLSINSTAASSSVTVNETVRRVGVVELAKEQGRKVVGFVRRKFSSKTPEEQLPKTWAEYEKAYGNYEIDLEDPPLPPQRIAADGAEPTPFQQRFFVAPRPPNEKERQNVVAAFDLFGTREKAAQNAFQAALDVSAPSAFPTSAATLPSSSTSSTVSSCLTPSETSLSRRTSSSGYSITSAATSVASAPSSSSPLDVVQSVQQHPVFRQIVARAKDVFQTRVSLLTILDDEQQLFIAATQGMPEGVDSMPRNASFCSHAILDEERGLAVLNSVEDWRFNNNAPTAMLGARFYAGVPIMARAGPNDPAVAIGTLCVLDDKPRDEFTEAHRRVLRDFAKQASNAIEAWVQERMTLKLARLHNFPAGKPALMSPPSLSTGLLTPPPSAGRASSVASRRPSTAPGPPTCPLPATPPASLHRFESRSIASHSRQGSDAESVASSVPPSQFVQPRQPTATSLRVTTEAPVSALPREVQKTFDTAVKMLAKALNLELVYLAALELSVLETPTSTDSDKLRILSSHGLPTAPPSFDPALHLKALRAPEGGLIYRNTQFDPAASNLTYAAGLLIPILEVRRMGFCLCGYTRKEGRDFVQRDLTYFVKFAEGLESACIKASKAGAGQGLLLDYKSLLNIPCGACSKRGSASTCSAAPSKRRKPNVNPAHELSQRQEAALSELRLFRTTLDSLRARLPGLEHYVANATLNDGQDSELDTVVKAFGDPVTELSSLRAEEDETPSSSSRAMAGASMSRRTSSSAVDPEGKANGAEPPRKKTRLSEPKKEENQQEHAVEAAVDLEFYTLGRPRTWTDSNMQAAAALVEDGDDPPSSPRHKLAVLPPEPQTESPVSRFPTGESLLTTAPELAVEQALIHVGLEQYGFHHAVVHLPTFRCQLAAFHDLGEDRFGRASLAWLSQYFAILAISAKLIPREETAAIGWTDDGMFKAASDWFDCSIACLYRFNFLQVHDFSALQAISLLVLSGRDAGSATLIASLLYSGLSIAQDMGLSRLPSDAQWDALMKGKPTRLRAKSLIDREIRKRVLWALAHSEWFAIPFKGYSSMAKAQVTTPLPLNATDEDLATGEVVNRPRDEYTVASWLLGYVEIGRSMRLAFEHATSEKSTAAQAYNSFLEADKQLEAVLQNLPKWLRQGEDTAGLPANAEIIRSTFLISVNHKILSIHRPFLAKPSRATTHAFARRRVIEAARAIAHEALLVPTNRIWTCIYHVSVGLFSLTLELYDQLKVPTPDNEAIRAEIEAALPMLEGLKDVSAIAERGLRLVLPLLEDERKLREEGGVFKDKKKGKKIAGPLPHLDLPNSATPTGLPSPFSHSFSPATAQPMLPVEAGAYDPSSFPFASVPLPPSHPYLPPLGYPLPPWLYNEQFLHSQLSGLDGAGSPSSSSAAATLAESTHLPASSPGVGNFPVNAFAGGYPGFGGVGFSVPTGPGGPAVGWGIPPPPFMGGGGAPGGIPGMGWEWMIGAAAGGSAMERTAGGGEGQGGVAEGEGAGGTG